MKMWLKSVLSIAFIFLIVGIYLMMTKTHTPTTVLSTQQKVIDIKDFNLQNGQTVWLATDPELDVVTIGIRFQYAGGQSNPKNKPGLSDFLVAMLDEGAGTYDSQAFKKQLIEKNVQLDISSNQDSIVVVFKTTSAHVDDAFKLVALALTEPRFLDDPFKRVQQQIAAALMQSMHKPESVAKEKILSTILGDDHVYAKNTQEQLHALSTITKDDLKKHLQKNITQSNMLIAVAGNISQDVLQKNLESFISVLPKGEVKSQKPSDKLLNGGKTIHHEMDVPQTVIMYAHPGIDRHDPDFYAAYLLIQGLGGNAFESRLWKEVREKRGLAYYVTLSLFNQKLNYGMLGSTGTKTASAQEVMQLIREEWKSAAESGISADELELQRQFINASYPLTFSTTSGIVKALLAYQDDGLSVNYVNERENLFNKVTMDDIKRVAKRLLKPEELTFIVVGKKE